MRLASLVSLAGCVIASMTSSLAIAQTPANQPATESQAMHYDTMTTRMRSLLEDPAAKAVLAKYIPELINKPERLANVMDLSLKELQQAVQPWSPNFLPDSALAQMGQELAQLPVKK